MTALPMHRQQLTAAEYAALPEDQDERFELQDGFRVMSPRPLLRHQRCLRELSIGLAAQLPGYEVMQEVDVDLQLVPPDRPGTVRVPDLVVVTSDSYSEADGQERILRASEVLLAVEVISPSSPRLDTRIKHGEYADAGISHYWMIDLEDGPSLTACHLAGEFGYADDAPVRGVLRTDAPFQLTIDLDRLR
jgi:Uma2 family endonuclease